MKETDLAKPLISWLGSHGFEVYQEVQVNGDIADIVAVLHGRLVHVIEVKTSLSMAVLAQADRWRHYAHWRSVATPIRRSVPGSVFEFTRHVCSAFGIGMLEVSNTYCSPILERIPASFSRQCCAGDVLRVLRPEHKTYAEAGNSIAKRWTPFKSTCLAIERYVAQNPGCDLKTLIGAIETHYASKSCASQCISHWAQAGKILGVRCERDGKRLRFFPSERTE